VGAPGDTGDDVRLAVTWVVPLHEYGVLLLRQVQSASPERAFPPVTVPANERESVPPPLGLEALHLTDDAEIVPPKDPSGVVNASALPVCATVAE
jgi:hypothetical protein